MLPNMMYLVPPPVLPGKALKEPWAPQHGRHLPLFYRRRPLHFAVKNSDDQPLYLRLRLLPEPPFQ